MQKSKLAMFLQNSLLRICTVAFIFLVSSNPAWAQNRSSTSGYTSPGQAPGSPAGSFALSDFDTINPYNGNLNFRMPLLNVGGRGDAGYSVTQSINIKWKMNHQWFGGMNEHFYGHWPQSSQKPYDRSYFTPGRMEVRHEIDTRGCSAEGGAYSEHWRMTFTRPDGTVHEFIDQQSGGVASVGSCGYGQQPAPDINRGRVFFTYDGSFITFFSDVAVSHYNYYLTGYLLFGDGTRYRVENNKIIWISDRDGNLTTFTYTQQGFTSIRDSNGREVTFAYDLQDTGQYGLHDRITYNGTNGEIREIRVSYKNLNEVLRYDQSLQTLGQLFPMYDPIGDSENELSNVGHLVSAIWLPNGQSYRFYYNSYGELARVELPTGGANEYDWGASLLGGHPTGSTYYSASNPPMLPDIHRRVLTKRIYPNGGSENNFETRITFSQTEGQGTPTSHNTIKTFDPSENLLSQQKQYFFSNPIPESENEPFIRPHWREGVEYKTEVFDVVNNSPILKRRTEKTWQGFGWGNPRNVETVTTLIDTNQVTKTTSSSPIDGSIGFDQFNNPTDVWEYGFGAGEPGQFLRRSHTDYVTDTNYTSHTGAHLRSLPSQTWVSSDINGATKASLTQFEYDNYITDAGHDALVSRSNVVGHDTTNYGIGNIRRGNVTAVTSYANAQAQTGAITAYSQYDILGNVVKAIDAKGCASTINYDDNFGAPDGEAQSNTPPSQLSGLNTFAFPKSATNCMGWITGYSQVDYFTGASVNTEDINGVISKTIYNDPLDRPTQAVSAIGTAHERQANIDYDDANRRIETKSDLFALNDNLIRSESFYDGLGRTFESRSYKDGGYVVSKSEFDALGRVKRVTNPYRPHLSEQELWTESFYDALGRVIKIKTPDNAEALTSYSGNAVTVTDQAGKLRRSITNALGQLTRVDEPNASNQLGTVATPNQPTLYTYDTLNNLTTVTQVGSGTEQCGPSGGTCSQTRTFAYNSLSQLLTAVNPESGTIGYQYDLNGNLTQKTDARGVQTNYIYDALNRVTQRNYSTPNGLPANYQATPNVAYTYDDASITNSKGKLTKVSSSVSTTEYTAFDILGRVTGHKQTTDGMAYTTGYIYNLSGALIEEIYPSGRKVKNVLDNNGDLSQVQSQKNATGIWRPYVSNFVYTAAGAVSSLKLGNGKFENTQFNSRLQPIQIGLGTSAGTQNLLKLDYEYGVLNLGTGQTIAGTNNGNVSKQTITVSTVGANNGFIATQYYAYDSLNRIQIATENVTPNGQSAQLSWRQQFGYDRYGNRNFDEANTTTLPKECSNNTEVCAAIRPVVNPSVNAVNNRLNGYTFDAAGNTIQDAELRKFTYDAENKQAKVETVNSGGTVTGTIGQYSYDGDGKRIKKKGYTNNVLTEATIFVYDAAGKLVAEYSSEIASVNDAKVAYLTNDHLGSPRINTDQNGTVTARHDYHPFGEEIGTLNGGSPHRTTALNYTTDNVRQKFTGYQHDNETQLDYAKARMFGHSHGRFTSPDPYNIVFEAKDAENKKKGDGQKLFSDYLAQSQNWNRYVYVWNNPLRNIDPDGEKVYVILYTIGNAKGDADFKRVAETRANDIRNSKGYDPKKDIVLVQGVRTVNDMEREIKLANALDTTWGNVQQLALVSHGGPADGPAFQWGTPNETWPTEPLTNLKINWEKGGEAYFLGCNTAVTFAQRFADKQGVDTWGFTTGTSFYSQSNPRTSKGSGIFTRPGAYDYMLFNTPLYMKSQGDDPNGNFVERKPPRRY